MAEKLHRQRERWSRWSQIVATTIGLCVAILLATSLNSTTSEAQTTMRSILDAISNESAAVTNQYLAGPENAAYVVAGMADQTAANPELERMLFSNLISATTQIDAVYVGFPDGSFRFVARANEPEATYRTRTIGGPDLQMTESYVDANLMPLRSAVIPDSTYDPRQRSWYEPIAQGATTNWSEPYIFSSSRKLGVTYSKAVIDDQGTLLGVVGVDVTLDDLVAFLKERRPSENGSAQVVDQSGRVLAGSSIDVAAMQAAFDRDEKWEIDVMTGAALAIQQSLQPAAGPTSRATGQFVNDDRWGNVQAVSGNENWYLLVEAPEEDFGAQRQSWLSTTSAKIALWSLLVCALVFAILRTAGNRLLRLSTMATVDGLTGQLNRAGIFSELGTTLSQQLASHTVVIAILDLDRFKAVNDTYGHAIGDSALTACAQRIAAVAEQHNMTCGRLGGDEFVVFGQTADPAEAAHVWPLIEAAISSLTEVDDVPIDLSTSIGVITVPFGSPLEVTGALHRADKALYQAKRCGGNQTVIDAHDHGQIVNLSEPLILSDSELAER